MQVMLNYYQKNFTFFSRFAVASRFHVPSCVLYRYRLLSVGFLLTFCLNFQGCRISYIKQGNLIEGQKVKRLQVNDIDSEIVRSIKIRFDSWGNCWSMDRDKKAGKLIKDSHPKLFRAWDPRFWSLNNRCSFCRWSRKVWLRLNYSLPVCCYVYILGWNDIRKLEKKLSNFSTFKYQNFNDVSKGWEASINSFVVYVENYGVIDAD